MSLLRPSILLKNGKSYVVPFVLITICFALWGFANDITNPMVKAFSKIFRMTTSEGTLVQVAFYGGYFAMAFPAALFIRRFTYQKGVVVGLGLYALGALLFVPAGWSGAFAPFLAAYFIMTCGLSFLETSCNPYILSMGPPESATRRLNFAQAFNPIGSLAGMFVAMNFIQSRLNPMSTDERALLNQADFDTLKADDLQILTTPYLLLGVVIAIMFLAILLVKMPETKSEGPLPDLRSTFRKLLANVNYREGVLAQFFYVGVQICCWTFIIQYGTRLFMSQGMAEQEAEVLSQQYNIVAMLLFCCSRFICTYFLRFVKPALLLTILALSALVLVLGVILSEGLLGLYCLVAVSACMSLMFPTIYGLSLQDMGEEAKLGSAGLIMAILGGSVLPSVQAAIIDGGSVIGIPGVQAGFIVPLLCFVVIALYGCRSLRRARM
ncbi:MAG: L-fucose:H+ symporter permease [Prevotellaceae bacterium]|nr:L-fucose:H+ symporter permease [Prevotella sp.]MDD7530406.1 L-fucose:H+ symporter permease [Prevotellaceae bacterium]MDY2633562.1 L-fucose:H+ symporter permease [Prevotella sp.]